MSRSAKNPEMHGSYRDPNTGKYFRQPSYGTPHVADTDTSNNYEAAGYRSSARNFFHRPSVLRSGNILDCVMNNRYGSSSSQVFQDDILSLKMQDLKTLVHNPFPKINKSHNIRMLKGSDTALYGQYIKNKKSESLIYAFEHSKKSQMPYDVYCGLATFPPNFSVSDFCEMNNQIPLSLLIVGNDLQTGTASAYFNIRLEDTTGDAVGLLEQLSLDRDVFCCCTNSFNDDYAIGFENGIYFKNSLDDLYLIKDHGKVFSVNFEENGNVIYAGLSTGNVIIYDKRRGSKEYESIQLHDSAINETTILRDGRYLICGGLDNVLCKVDLRMLHVAVFYSGDRRSARRIPISINEFFNVLCSTGSDNITRLWSLSSGKLLKSISPPVPGPDCCSWLSGYSAKFSLYITQQKKMYFYEF